MGAKRRKTSVFTPSLRAQGKGPVKRTQRTAFDPHGSDDTTYAVREIKAEGQRCGKPAWLIGWEGFDDSADSWEPIENLAGHEQDIASFRKREEVRLAALDAETRKPKAAAPTQENADTIDNGACTLDGHCPTSFPSGPNVASTFNRDIIRQMAAIMGTELRALFNLGLVRGLDIWGPVINLNRDPRWVSESL